MYKNSIENVRESRDLMHDAKNILTQAKSQITVNNPSIRPSVLRLNAEILVHSEVIANELGFSGLSPKILFYKRVKWFKIFYDKFKPLIESKDSKMYFCNNFIIFRLSMYLKVLLYSLRSNSLC